MFQEKLLTSAGVDRLADGVLTVLERVGVLCQNDELLRALEDFGAVVDWEAGIARLPRRLTADFVEALRQEAGREPDPWPDRLVAPPLPTLETQVAQFYYDDATCERRPGGREDFIALVRFGEALHPEQGVGHALILQDAPPMVEPLEAALLLAEYSAKPGPAFAWNVNQVDYLIEMGEILGIPQWYTWGAVCFAHPLRFDKDVADKFVRMAKESAPTGLTSMAIGAVSAPAPLAGFIVVAAAEFVITWLAARALNPDAPLGRRRTAGGPGEFSGSMWASTVDMRTGTASYSAPDAMLRACAVVEFLRQWCWKRVPVGGGEYSDAREPGLYAALEKAYKAMTIAAFTGFHPPIGQGMLETGKTLSPAQLLIERDLSAGVAHLADEIDVTDVNLALEDILAVGHGLQQSHLTTETTLRHYRNAFWNPKLIDRSGWNGPAYDAALLDKANREVRRLEAAYRKPEVDPDKLHAMRQVVTRARRRLL
jgi:trimethylamine:corrinoid methyltransferase-like protein